MQRATTSVRKVREQVEELLKQAEEKKVESFPDAIKILDEASKLLPQLAVETPAGGGRGSVKQGYQNKATQEIFYTGKRGHIFYELKEYEEAQKCYQFIKQKLPNNVEVHKSLGDCLRKLKKFEEASEMYDRGFAVYDKDDLATPKMKSALLNNRGLNYMEQQKYTEAKNDFEAAVKMTTKDPNPLYLCNKGYALYALNEKDAALKSFEEADKLVQSGNLTGLTGHNIQYIKEMLKEFIEGLGILKSVSTEDEAIKARGLDILKSGVNALETPQEEEEQGEQEPEQEQKEKQGKGEELGKEKPKIPFSMVKAAARLKKINEDIKAFKKDPKVIEYYDGFMFTLTQSYKTAVVINSGQVLAASSTEIEVLTSALKLVPLLGDQLAEVARFAGDVRVTKAATEICKFATTEVMFTAIVQDALVDFMKAEKKRILAQEEDDLDKVVLPRWASKFKKITDKIEKINKLKGKAEEMLYGERNETAFQRFGYQTANTLISEHIASGKIYGDEKAIKISKTEKQKRLIEKMKIVFEKSLDKMQGIELENVKQSTTCESCNMF